MLTRFAWDNLKEKLFSEQYLLEVAILSKNLRLAALPANRLKA